MPSQLYQLELGYNPLQDRLVLKIYTSDLSEFSFWLTRRFSKILWDILNKLLKDNEKNQLQREQETKKVSEAFNEEQAKKQPLANKFANKITKTPLGTEPLLASRLTVKPGDQGITHLQIGTETGENIEILANNYILLSLCKLLSETVIKTDWDLNFD